jgi:hypothetical protein
VGLVLLPAHPWPGWQGKENPQDMIARRSLAERPPAILALLSRCQSPTPMLSLGDRRRHSNPKRQRGTSAQTKKDFLRCNTRWLERKPFGVSLLRFMQFCIDRGDFDIGRARGTILRLFG